MNPHDTPYNAPESPANGPQWLCVADFARLRGVSVRTVKRWIENGEVATRKDGARRFVRALEEGHKGDAEGTQQRGHAPEVVSLSPSVHTQKEGHKGHGEGTQRDTEEARAVSLSSDREAQLLEELARERELNGFFRGLIEGHQRAEAELRAALREALKAQTKQLSASESSTIEQTARIAQNGPQDGGMYSLDASEGDRMSAKRKETYLSYGDIADRLEQEMNQ